MQKKLGKALLATALLSTLIYGAPTVMNVQTADAAYALNDEVKDATPALKAASEIGMRVYNNPQLQHLPNKDAILVMSFGTTFPETRAKTINATVDAIKDAHPGVKVVTAFTSHIIMDRIAEKQGIHYPTPEQALKYLKDKGYSRVELVSLDIIPGLEYSYQAAVYNIYKHDFKKMTLATPAIYWMGQEEQPDDIVTFLNAFKSQFPKLGEHDALMIMAHGTPDPSNAYYAVIQDRLESMGFKNTFIYTVEGWPRIEDVLPVLKERGIKNVTLMPMMMVAGDHASNDMAGDEEDSHKVILREHGYNVNVYLHGLGENPDVRKVFVDHANEAWDALQDPNFKVKCGEEIEEHHEADKDELLPLMQPVK